MIYMPLRSPFIKILLDNDLKIIGYTFWTNHHKLYLKYKQMSLKWLNKTVKTSILKVK